MGIRTGAELIAGLDDGREPYIDGERVGDLAGDPRFAGGLGTLAELYDMQHAGGLVDEMTYVSPSSGERVGLSFIQPRTREDLARRRVMVKH